MSRTDYFALLGLDPGAGTAEIKQAYRRLAFKYHPDHNQDRSARDKYIEINRAYRILSDPVARERHLTGRPDRVTDQPWAELTRYWRAGHDQALGRADEDR